MQDHSSQNIALRYSAFGDPRQVLSLESHPLAAAAPDSVRVRMHLAPVNPSDLIPVTGAYSHLITPPMTAGYEGVGTVVSAPSAYQHLLGRRVLPLRGPGTWQHYVDCDPALAVPVPDDIPDTLAARAYINPLSAYHMLRLWPVAGKRVLLSGAGSFIAALLAQWALADGAAQVTGLYRSPQRRAWLETLGVHPVAETEATAIRDAAKQADITFDALGGAIGSAVLGAMHPGSTFVSYGLLSGQPILPPPGISAAYRRFHLRDVLGDLTAAEWQNGFGHLWPKLRSAQLPQTDIFPVTQWQDALDAFTIPGRAHKPLLAFPDETGHA